MVALRKLITANRAHVVRQHGGMGKGATRDLDFVVNAELGLRSNPPQDTTEEAANPLQRLQGRRSQHQNTMASSTRLPTDTTR
jgi:hypothetical protein